MLRRTTSDHLVIGDLHFSVLGAQTSLRLELNRVVVGSIGKIYEVHGNQSSPS
jgi:hypothetical protein